MCLNVKAFGAVAEFHPYRVTWRNIAVTLTTRESARHWADCRQLLPWDYFRLARHLPTIGPLRGCECKRLITTVRNPRSTEALEVVSSQQLGHASPWLALDRECPDPRLPRHLSCNPFAVQGMSLSSGLIRSTDMIGHSFMTWEASVSLESEVAQLRRGDRMYLGHHLEGVDLVRG